MLFRSSFERELSTDGLLGLSFSSLNTVKPQKQLTFFDTVKPQLADAVFAVALKYHAPGSYDFGFIDTAKFVGEMEYVDVDAANGFWEFPIKGYAFAGGAATATTGLTAIGDTGTTLSYLPKAILTAYYARVPGAEDSYAEGGWVFPCAAVLPDMELLIGDSRQVLRGKYVNYAPVRQGAATCYGGLQDSEEMEFGILGDTFLKEKYVVHEARATKARIGFAEQVAV